MPSGLSNIASFTQIFYPTITIQLIALFKLILKQIYQSLLNLSIFFKAYKNRTQTEILVWILNLEILPF